LCHTQHQLMQENKGCVHFPCKSKIFPLLPITSNL
jgi:hypothetical protein